MLRLIKYLKRDIVPIIFIVLLLIFQSICDLSLPDYTAKIVNVGIQQQGIEDAVPNVITNKTFAELESLMSDNDKKVVEQNYTMLDKENLTQDKYDKYIKSYPALKDQPINKLNDKITKETREELNQIFGHSLMAMSILNSDNSQVSGIKQQLITAMPAQQQETLSQMSAFEIINSLPDLSKKQIIQKIREQVNSIPDLVITQSSIPMLKEEYKKIGIDLDKMQMNYIMLAGVRMLFVALASIIAVIVVVMLASRVGASLGRELRNRTFNKVMDFSGHEMSKFSTASLITRSTNDIQQIQLLMVMLLRIVFYAPIIGIGGVIKVKNAQTNLLWVIALAVITIALVVALLFIFVMPKFKSMQKLVDRINLVMREILTGIPVIRAFSAQQHENERFDIENKKLTNTNIFVNRVMGCMMPIMMFIMNSVAILIVWEGGKNIDAGDMQVGNMMAVIQYSMQIIMAFLMICMISVMLPRASVAAKRIEEVLQTEIEIKDPVVATNFIESQRGVVSFDNVSFKYPGAEENILSNITFTANPGETTAIIGSTGCGKSTLVNLIPRFFDVTDGKISVGGVNIKKVKLYDLRAKIGYVPQKSYLFSGDINSNISYGKNLTQKEIIRAAQIAQASDFIEEKPQKYNEEISQGGTNVSGGQRQRLSIARAIGNNPDIYIFDDSFSALDYKTDSKLRKVLKEATGNATVIIVAQRISTIINAEKIIVLDKGMIVGMGKHSELLNSCPIYREIAESQLSKEELNG